MRCQRLTDRSNTGQVAPPQGWRRCPHVVETQPRCCAPVVRRKSTVRIFCVAGVSAVKSFRVQNIECQVQIRSLLAPFVIVNTQFDVVPKEIRIITCCPRGSVRVHEGVQESLDELSERIDHVSCSRVLCLNKRYGWSKSAVCPKRPVPPTLSHERS